MTTVLGVDGYPKGWVGIWLNEAGFWHADVNTALVELIASVPNTQWVAVDIPIGCPESGSRMADLLARKFLGERRSSVFPTPPRASLGAETYEKASEVARELNGKGLSRQAFELRTKILEAERVAEADPRLSKFIQKYHSWRFAKLIMTTNSYPRTRKPGMDSRNG